MKKLSVTKFLVAVLGMVCLLTVSASAIVPNETGFNYHEVTDATRVKLFFAPFAMDEERRNVDLQYIDVDVFYDLTSETDFTRKSFRFPTRRSSDGKTWVIDLFEQYDLKEGYNVFHSAGVSTDDIKGPTSQSTVKLIVSPPPDPTPTPEPPSPTPTPSPKPIVPPLLILQSVEPINE